MTATNSEPLAAFATEGHRPLLIEDWLPIRELSIESAQRESDPRPPLNGLHVWWARAPLAAASGVQLAAVLPAWEDELLDHVPAMRDALARVRAARRDLPSDASNKQAYRAWVLWLCGIRGDVVRAYAAFLHAKESGERIPNPYTWRPAFNNKPSTADLVALHGVLTHHWGRLPTVLDPTAGGGAIPYTAMRFGLPTFANDVNPVAVSVLDATLVGASRFGPALVPEVERWGRELVGRVGRRLAPFFPSLPDGEEVATYIFANTVACPRTGGPVPLSPNWWLDKAQGGIAVRPRAVRAADGTPSHVEFDIVSAPKSQGFDPDVGTVAGGDGISLWDGLVVSGDHIKEEARAGRMRPTLFAVAVRKPKGKRGWHRYFRAPTTVDMTALAEAENELERLGREWSRDDVLPTEDIGISNYDRGHRLYGMTSWRSMFTPRQLLVQGVFTEEWRRLSPEVQDALGERADDVLAVLSLLQGKAVNWNSRLSSWDVSKQKLRSTFDKHSYSFKWTTGEFEGASALWLWALESVMEKYRGVVDLLQPQDDPDGAAEQLPVPGHVTLSSGSGSSLPHIPAESIECVNIDPPYYDNVQYAELSDFFYVWLKRTLGRIRRDRFTEELTNKDDEAVANPARFADAGRRKSELATFDYQQKMKAIFTECHRVLRPDGVMVVWFTHKRAEAWDTLGTAMMDAGFTIEASWPVKTQSERSLHHAEKNSAKSTVMLVCRKRHGGAGGTFFDDIERDVREAAQAAVKKFEADVGVGGVDLLLSTYGPTLSVISREWPVLSSEAGEDGRARRLKPEEALLVARQEVARLRMARLVGREVRFDAATDFWLMAWETFRAREFPYDEARKLAFGVGYDVEDAVGAGLLVKKTGTVSLTPPGKRAPRLRRDAGDDGRFDSPVDAIHHMLNVYETDGLAAAQRWLSDSGYEAERAFVDAVQASVRAVPRVRDKAGFTLDEARSLDETVVALMGDLIELPVAAEAAPVAEQIAFDV